MQLQAGQQVANNQGLEADLGCRRAVLPATTRRQGVTGGDAEGGAEAGANLVNLEMTSLGDRHTAVVVPMGKAASLLGCRGHPPCPHGVADQANRGMAGDRCPGECLKDSLRGACHRHSVDRRREGRGLHHPWTWALRGQLRGLKACRLEGSSLRRGELYRRHRMSCRC